MKSIHFDSAWVPYTNFSPIYEGKCGMSGGRVEGKVIYETQSTHKLAGGVLPCVDDPRERRR